MSIWTIPTLSARHMILRLIWRSKDGKHLLAVAFDRRHRERGYVLQPCILTAFRRAGPHMDPANCKPWSIRSVSSLKQRVCPFPVQDHPSGLRNIRVGGRGCLGWRDWWPVLRELSCRKIVSDDVIISAISEGVRGYATRSQQCRGTLEEERRTGRRVLLAPASEW